MYIPVHTSILGFISSRPHWPAWSSASVHSPWQKLQYNFEMRQLFVMCQHYKASFSPDLSHLLVPDDLWYLFCYLFPGSDAMKCMWVGRLSWGPRPGPLLMWSGPTWSGIWPGPVGPRLEAENWSAASLECQTFEVRLVKKERRVVGVWSNRPLCLK